MVTRLQCWQPHVSLSLPLTTVGSTTLSVVTLHCLYQWGTQSNRGGEKSSPLLVLLLSNNNGESFSLLRDLHVLHWCHINLKFSRHVLGTVSPLGEAAYKGRHITMYMGHGVVLAKFMSQCSLKYYPRDCSYSQRKIESFSIFKLKYFPSLKVKLSQPVSLLTPVSSTVT